jgi:glucose-1-phosphate adenylyltransferase
MGSLKDTLAIILGGGRGTRLHPLTSQRSKPAVPIAGKYRLIDVPLSNCINSGIYRIAVLTQFNSVSLHRHIARTYHFDVFHHGWVQIWAAEQTFQSNDWYQGTADAVRKQLMQIRSTRAKDIVILAGDHLYRMDYAEMLRFHWEKDADVTVAVQPVSHKEAGRFGILKRSKDCLLTDFCEKPTDPKVLETLVSRDDPERPYLGSMGIYIFKAEALYDELALEQHDDFGGDVIPGAIQKRKVYGYDFKGYWEDIGTIRSFYDANLLLTKQDSPFNFFAANQPIYTHARFLPGSIVEETHLKDVLLAEGCIIRNAEIENSVIGLRSQIRSRAKIKNSIIMGADYYDRPNNDVCADDIPIGIGQDCYIEGAIIDKNVFLGCNVVIRPFPRGTELDGPNYVVRDGIVVIPKNAYIPNDVYIGPK